MGYMQNKNKKAFRLQKSNKVCPGCKNTLIKKSDDVLVCNNRFCDSILFKEDKRGILTSMFAING